LQPNLHERNGPGEYNQLPTDFNTCRPFDVELVHDCCYCAYKLVVRSYLQLDNDGCDCAAGCFDTQDDHNCCRCPDKLANSFYVKLDYEDCFSSHELAGSFRFVCFLGGCIGCCDGHELGSVCFRPNPVAMEAVGLGVEAGAIWSCRTFSSAGSVWR